MKRRSPTVGSMFLVAVTSLGVLLPCLPRPVGRLPRAAGIPDDPSRGRGRDPVLLAHVFNTRLA
jgi:hypothetical protein